MPYEETMKHVDPSRICLHNNLHMICNLLRASKYRTPRKNIMGVSYWNLILVLSTE